MEPIFEDSSHLHRDSNNNDYYVYQQPDGGGREKRVDDDSHLSLHEKLRGVPQRPLYLELTHRLLIIHQHKNQATQCSNPNTDVTDDTFFLPASHFGMTERQSMNSLIPDPPKDLTSVEECTIWLQKAGSNGIYAILGMRQTIGTVSKFFEGDEKNDLNVKPSPVQYLLPPCTPQLITASCKLHKPNTKSNLTVAARAFAKHSHRGECSIFGAVQGSESRKNDQAYEIVKRLIQHAAWINIHCFGALDNSRPVVEVRTMDGYGARWSAIWRKNAFFPEDVEFRGFLEPQMEHGHEKRWRH